MGSLYSGYSLLLCSRKKINLFPTATCCKSLNKEIPLCKLNDFLYVPFLYLNEQKRILIYKTNQKYVGFDSVSKIYDDKQ